MKQTFSLLIVALFLSFSVSAQKIGRCASNEYLKELDKKYPGMEAYVKNLPKQVTSTKNTRAQVITVPVVVHIVYNTAAENLTDDYVTAQIDILNKCFLRQNSDTVNLRSEFLPYVGPAKIQFMCVQIIRKSTVTTKYNYIVDQWGNNTADYVKLTSQGGDDAITPDKKLNIWVCDIGDDQGSDNLLGYAYPPSGMPNWGGQQFPTGSFEGVVIDYMAFGGTTKLPKGNAAYGCKGKTAVHEIGHYLGLRHIWGDDDGACTGQPNYEDDGINDTPVAADMSNFDCNKTKNTCNQGAGDLKDMVENYMDYSLESCENSFTKEQVALMESVLNNQRINVRVPTKIEDYDFSANLAVFPNPADNILNVNIINLEYDNADIYLFNSIGQAVKKISLTKGNNSAVFDVNNLPKGMYIIRTVLDNNYSNNQKVIIQ